MSERVVLRQSYQGPDVEGYHSFSNAEKGPKTVIVDVYPGVDGQNNPTLPATLCDRVSITVGPAGSGGADHRNRLISTFEMPVTEPPRTAEEFADLAQRLADLTIGHADQVFALY